MMLEKRKFLSISSEDVFLAYELLLEQQQVSFALTDDARKKIDSLIHSINDPHFGVQLYPTRELRAVAYLYFIIKDHPFIDGNKRMGVLIFDLFCYTNNIKITSDFQLDSLALFIEKIQEKNHKKVIHFLSEQLFSSRN